ncbi:MAG: YhjD/YihY/BrkB family envelope integrity protein [Gaiellaceae bacterium]
MRLQSLRDRLASAAERAPELERWARARVPGADLALDAARRELRAFGGLVAGGLAYRLFLWLVPFGLVVATLLGFWLEIDPDAVRQAGREFGIGAASIGEASRAVEARPGSRVAILLLGLWLLAWFTLGAVRALRLAAALAWGLERTRMRKPAHAVGVFNGLFLAAALSFAALAWFRDVLGAGALLTSAGLLAIQIMIALAIFWLLPRRADRWQDLLPGAALLAVGAELMHVVVAFYFVPRLERSSELYGALGTATVLLVWLYLYARLFTSGMFLNATLWERRRAPSP